MPKSMPGGQRFALRPGQADSLSRLPFSPGRSRAVVVLCALPDPALTQRPACVKRTGSISSRMPVYCGCFCFRPEACALNAPACF